MTDDSLRYPIGHWSVPSTTDAATLAGLVDAIAEAPARLRAAVAGLSDAQLDTPYRDGGWTVRQVVHHVADSHANAYIRVKKALTEPGAPIVAYEEARWAELPDSRLPIDVSLALLDALHVRWVTNLRAATPDDLVKTYRHPELGEVPLTSAMAMYAWHGRHHTAHVTRLRERMGW
ncbi:YfiT family bacillithiol transferase [Roseisolibacter sp. H3M3-2]|uniref:YfiT family bacillithiol transferase n=1 Tax=Roseisolibacter sp. H3M3-2 TaxID=3031323 RepID=UPI0023DAFB77|nr:putative metal-dependent hydrolase [Roseisolibacter sp. H3M3-2]MDF1504058.1 putative metal-dependent hydrolase [Roseisolibacter sp. H3M3-2]